MTRQFRTANRNTVPPTPRAPAARAFTLVELLVVVSIIALLISILLPSLCSARQQTKNLVCLSNLRTLGQGVMTYSADYKGRLPGPLHPAVYRDMGDGGGGGSHAKNRQLTWLLKKSFSDSSAQADSITDRVATCPVMDSVVPPSHFKSFVAGTGRTVHPTHYVINNVGENNIEARAGGTARALRRLVETLGCPAMTTYKAKGVIADDHPQTIGHFTGARSEAEALARTESQADLIVFVGVDPVELIAAPWFLEAPVLALSAHPAGPAFPVAPAARLHGPLGLCVEAVAGAAVESDWTEAEPGALKRRLRDRLRLDGKGHTAETVVAAAAALAAGLSPGRARATVDAGAHMFSTMAEWRAAAPYDVLKSTGLSTMGFALPAAIAAALAEPARPVIAFTGDGGLLMCLAELSTAARLGCNLTVVVFNDAALALIDVKQQRQQRPPSGVRYPAVDFAAAARGLGCQAWKVGPDDPLEPALRAAFAHPGPALVDVTIDPSGYGAQLAALRG